MQEEECERCGNKNNRMAIITYGGVEQETICTGCFNEEMAERYEIPCRDG
ncbi:MAG TPA: hypothetical protein VIO64_05310 [Pseudobacteroides sp.]